MRKLYWNSEVQRNWQGALRDEMLDNNILCYGKPNSGKTDKVAKPFMRRTIERGDSLILVINNVRTDYSDVYKLADEQNYIIEDYDVRYFPDYDRDEINALGRQLVEHLMEDQILLRVRMDTSRKQEFNSLLAFIYIMTRMERNPPENFEFWNISMVVEDSNWELLLPDNMPKLTWLNFCITVSSERLCASDIIANRIESLRKRFGVEEGRFLDPEKSFRRELEAAIQSGNHQKAKAVLDSSIHMDSYFSNIAPICHRDNVSLAYPESISEAENMIESFARHDSLRAVKGFLEGVQTVICTGVTGIVPEEHRAFVAGTLVSDGIRAPGGKFLVTDLTAPFQAVPKSIFPKTVMEVKRISVEDYLHFDFLPGRCVIEQNGVVKMFAAADGSLVPFLFRACADAMEWVERYYVQMGWGWPEPVEVDTCNVRYLLPAQEAGEKQDEIIISYIQKEDVQSYVDQAMLILLEVETYLNDPKRLDTVPGLEKGREAANVSLQKLVAHVCRELNRVQKSESRELPFDEEAQQTVASMIEEYKWRPYQKAKTADSALAQENSRVQLPEKRVLFMGGHANMVKKLRQYFPDWDFLTDDEFGSWTGGECDVIFFWSGHCSHSLQHYVEARKSKDISYLYVTATNMKRLIGEMSARYQEYVEKQELCVC